MCKATKENKGCNAQVQGNRPKRPIWAYPPVDQADAERKIRAFVAEHQEILEALEKV